MAIKHGEAVIDVGENDRGTSSPKQEAKEAGKSIGDWLSEKERSAAREHPVITGMAATIGADVAYNKVVKPLAGKVKNMAGGLARGAAQGVAQEATEETARGLFGGALKSIVRGIKLK